MEDTERILKFIEEHREAATRFRECCSAASKSENVKELLDQARDCECIAGWLEELLTLRRVLECQFLNKDGEYESIIKYYSNSPTL